MYRQETIDFKPHNNCDSQKQYDDNIEHYQSQDDRVLNWLLSGIEVSSDFCYNQVPKIMDARARIYRLRRKLGYLISEKKNGLCKVWFCSRDQITKNIELRNEYNKKKAA